jgi:multidrug transporter EmrE-like cation transporter
MSILLLILAILLQCVSILLVREKRGLSTRSFKIGLGLLTFVASCIVMISAFGFLAGVIVALALLSLLGMVFPMLQKS